MRFHNIPYAFTALLISLTVSAIEPTKVTIWAWPLSAASPHPLADVSYSAADDEFTPAVGNYKPPEIAYTADDLVRVGLYDPTTSEWRGSITSAASFHPQNHHRLSVHVDEAGLPYHVDFASFFKPVDPREERRRERKAAKESQKPKKQKPVKDRKKEEQEDLSQPIIEIIKQKEGPTPYLNAPVVVSDDGSAPEGEPEKTFLQKYWYLIAIFLVVQLVAGGGGGGGGGESK